VIEPVIQRHTGDADAVIAHVGEIGKPQPSWRMLLPEDDVLLGPVQRPPGTDAPLQRAANTDADLGMATPDLIENGHRSKAWSALQQRPYLAVPNLSERVATSAATRRFCGVGFSAQGLFEGSYYRRMPGAADPRAAWIFEAQRRLSR
jgi:hypothetical protein